MNGHDTIYQLLKENGSDQNAKDNDGNTPLHGGEYLLKD